MSFSIFRLTFTSSSSLNCTGPSLFGFSTVTETSAIFLDGLFDVPENITSSIPDPRILFADVSPITHLRDSTILDLPHPFGPTIPVNPSSIKKLVLSANDLNPLSCIFLNSMNLVISAFQEFFLNFCNLRIFQTFCY